MMASTIGITCTLGNLTWSPSIAVVTVILGVIIPSASSAQPPIMAGMTSHFAFLRTKEYKEKIPPSPLLSALNVMTTYLMVVCNVSVQIIQDKAPNTNNGVIFCPLLSTVLNIALKVYNGDVPMSPYTIPKLIKRPPAESLFRFFFSNTIVIF